MKFRQISLRLPFRGKVAQGRVYQQVENPQILIKADQPQCKSAHVGTEICQLSESAEMKVKLNSFICSNSAPVTSWSGDSSSVGEGSS